MALLEDAFKGNVLTSVAVGVGALMLAPIIVPIARPMIKAVIKAGLVAYDQGRIAAAELGEGYEDLVAEARAEMAGPNGGTEPAKRPAAKSS
ncbi:DUF5132 domain-containing protein [Sinorhizobium garamanticum]|uniref:DUF5132 domain-containing protein n=1 Tax=Sinorhizobium garamanticum TaxID=680247 RepID=A0ABY8DI63_9HYPH|nr:DUF5132 domain-containing protein [Sinorhizobium garamanticum]WEX89902.1 DUF5132 domain-containing protein [Sinorhizobium garamanticum]